MSSGMLYPVFVAQFIGCSSWGMPNFGMGTQAIYSTKDNVYNFTGEDALTEQSSKIIQMGSNQMKLRLAPKATCEGYHITCGENVKSLKTLAEVPAVADTFARPEIVWYQMWLYSFANENFLSKDWTHEMVEMEYNETKEWAIHMLQTYSGTGKVFMAGNWEGDWSLMGASGCNKGGKFDMSCDPSAAVIDRMVQWGLARQRAIEDARSEANATNVTLVHYLEMNLGPQAVKGKPGVTNNVIPRVNPDYVSYSSYTSTNAYATTSDVKATDAALHKVLDYVVSKLPHKAGVVDQLGLGRRLFIGEYGTHGKTDFEVVRFVSRVAHAAFKWGTPFLLYWEFYDNNSTSPIVPKSGAVTPLWQLFHHFYAAARAFYDAHGGKSTPAAFNEFATNYFATPSTPDCNFVPGIAYSMHGTGEGYSCLAKSQDDCCAICAADPSCIVGVFSQGHCYVRYELSAKKRGDGVACVKKTRSMGVATEYI